MRSLNIMPVVFLFLCIAIFRVALDLSYIFFVNPYFAYAGFDIDLQLNNYIISWVFTLFSVFVVSPQINKPSDYFFMMGVLSLLLPLTSMYGLTDRPIEPLVVTIASLTLISFILKIKSPFIVKPIYIKNGQKVALNISIFFVLWLIAWYFISGAYKYFNLDFSKVYDFRALSSAASRVGLMSYITGWTYKVFIVYLLSYALMKKKFAHVIVIIIIQVFFYGVSSHKSVLFTPFMVISVWFYLRRFKTLLTMPIGFSLIILISYLAFVLFDNTMMPSMFIRRVFFVPAKLSFDYFEFFNENSFVYWSNSVLSFFIEYPYHLSPAKLIGEYNDSDSFANNGFISSGFSHFGIPGVILYSIAFGIVLRFVNYAAFFGLPIWFVLTLIIGPLRDALISSDLFTALLTHGLIVGIFLLLLSISKHQK